MHACVGVGTGNFLSVGSFFIWAAKINTERGKQIKESEKVKKACDE
jgi:hypothetical protein